MDLPGRQARITCRQYGKSQHSGDDSGFELYRKVSNFAQSSQRAYGQCCKHLSRRLVHTADSADVPAYIAKKGAEEAIAKSIVLAFPRR